MGVAAGTLPTGAVLLDTGLLVALHLADDRWHRTAVQWLRTFDGRLITVEAVLVETAFFPPVRQRAALAQLAANGTIEVRALDPPGLKRVGFLLDKYAGLDPDWADACLVWLAETSGVHRIVTVDETDFSTYRINGRTRFEQIRWRGASW